MEAHVLFNSWVLSSTGRDTPTCNKALPLNLNKSNVVKPCSELKKKEHQLSHDIAAEETKKKTEFFGMTKNEDERSKTRETGEIKQIDDCKYFTARTIQTKKQSARPMKFLKNPRSGAHGTGEIKQNLKKPDVCKSVPAKSRPLKLKKQPPVKVSENPKSCPALKKNPTETLELFEIAKKSADVANAKGLLAAEEETSICVDTLALLMEIPISSTATETRRIMVRLEHLTKHKNRKICNSASALLHCWRQSIGDQELRECRKTQG